LVLLLGAPVIAHAQSQPASPAPPATAAQDGFVPVSQLPPQEQLPAAPLVIGAYGFMWVAVLVYVWSLSRRLTDVRKDLDVLKRRQG
jgi:CcmD family protein